MTAKAKAKRSILIIDDSDADRDVYERLLRQDPGIDDVHAAATGDDGLKLFETVRSDCVLLDYQLPGPDGLETLKKIKNVDPGASVVMLTGQGSEDVAVAAMKAGAADYIVKDAVSAVGLHRAVGDAIDKTCLQRKIASQREEQEFFVRTLVHDVRAPLRHVSTFSQFMTADIEAGDLGSLKGHCADIAVAAKRIEGLIDTLASYSLAEAAVTFERVCMNDVVGQVLENLAHRIQDRQAVVRYDTLPSVVGHAPQLIQLFQNLIGNGIKYCEAEQPVIDIDVGDLDADGKRVFNVRDNGIGIPENKLADVFRPFERLWSQDDYEGTGLGLAICEKIVKRHGGRIWCESQVGQGSTFFFTLDNVAFAEEGARLVS